MISKKVLIFQDLYYTTFYVTYRIGCLYNSMLPSLKRGYYKIHIQQDPKGNYWLNNIAWIRVEHYDSTQYICADGFIKLFGRKNYNSLPKERTRYNITFKPV